MLVVCRGPGDLVQVHLIFRLQNATSPEACRDGITAVDGDGAAFQVFRFRDPRFNVVEDGPVVEISGEEDGNRCDGFAAYALAQR